MLSNLVHHRTLFNSHPHKEDDDPTATIMDDIRFSTHILTRRMTVFPAYLKCGRSFQLTSSQGG